MGFEHLAAERVPMHRRRALEAAAKAPHFLTDVKLIEDVGFQIELREALTGIRRQGRTPIYRPELASPRSYKFRTVDGKPLGFFKTGPVEGSVRQLHALAVRGLPLDEGITFDDPVFEVPATLGLLLLDRLGWGLVFPRYHMRNAAQLGEKDAYGRPVKPRDRWLVVEVGSIMERQCREAGELVDLEAPPAAKESAPPAPKREAAAAAPPAPEEAAEVLAALGEAKGEETPQDGAEAPERARTVPRRGRRE